MEPIITTIIPTYRRPTLLRRAIYSALNQTYPHLQVCVYDNASGDETASVVAEIAKKDPRVKYYCHSKNIGALENFIYGMNHIETPFFACFSDDDVYLPNFYQTAMEKLQRYPNAMFFTGITATVENDSGKVIGIIPLFPQWTKEGEHLPPDGLMQMFNEGHPNWTSIIFRKQVIEKIGVVNPAIGAPSDSDFVLRAATQFSFVISKEICGFLVHHPLSYSVRTSHLSVYSGWIRIIYSLLDNKQIPLYIKHRLRKEIKKLLLKFGMKIIRDNTMKEGYEMSNILRKQYHLISESIIFYSLMKCCEYFSPIPFFVRWLCSIRNFVKKDKWQQFQRQLEKEIGNISTYLKIVP